MISHLQARPFRVAVDLAGSSSINGLLVNIFIGHVPRKEGYQDNSSDSNKRGNDECPFLTKMNLNIGEGFCTDSGPQHGKDFTRSTRK